MMVYGTYLSEVLTGGRSMAKRSSVYFVDVVKKDTLL